MRATAVFFRGLVFCILCNVASFVIGLFIVVLWNTRLSHLLSRLGAVGSMTAMLALHMFQYSITGYRFCEQRGVVEEEVEAARCGLVQICLLWFDKGP